MKRGREEESESREENLYLEKSEADLEVMRKGIRRLIRVEEMEKEEAVGREKVAEAIVRREKREEEEVESVRKQRQRKGAE